MILAFTNTKIDFYKQPACIRIRTSPGTLRALHNRSQLGLTSNRLNLAKPIRQESVS